MPVHELNLPKETAALGDARAFTEKVVADSPFDEKQRRLLVLAIDEAVTCFVGYAEAHGALDGSITLKLSLDEVCLSVGITDSHTDCDPGELSPVEMMENFSEEPRHRLGIFFIRAIMDEVRYVYRRGFENQFQMLKFTPSRA